MPCRHYWRLNKKTIHKSRLKKIPKIRCKAGAGDLYIKSGHGSREARSLVVVTTPLSLTLVLSWPPPVYVSRSPPLQSQWAAFSASRRLGTISPSSLTGTAHCSRGLREWQPRAKEGKPDGLRDVGGGGVIFRHPFSRELLPHRRTVSFVEIASARGRQAMCLTCLLPVQDR